MNTTGFSIKGMPHFHGLIYLLCRESQPPGIQAEGRELVDFALY